MRVRVGWNLRKFEKKNYKTKKIKKAKEKRRKVSLHLTKFSRMLY